MRSENNGRAESEMSFIRAAPGHAPVTPGTTWD